MNADIANMLRTGNHYGRSALATALGAAAASTANLANPLVTSGAINPAQECTRISTTGSTALTIAAGTFPGQRIFLIQRVAASTPSAVVTPAAALNFTSFNMGTAVGNSAMLVWSGSAWILAMLSGTGTSIT